MICRTVKSMAPLHAGRELPEAMLNRLDAHVDHCDGCEEHLAALLEDRERLQAALAMPEDDAMPASLGDNFWFGIRRELRTSGLVGLQPVRAPVAWWQNGLVVRGLAAAVVMVCAVAYGLYGGGSDPGTSSSGFTAKRAPARSSAPAVLEIRTDASGLERVSTQGGDEGLLEPVEPFAGDDEPVEYQLEGWRAGSSREVMDF